MNKAMRYAIVHGGGTDEGEAQAYKEFSECPACGGDGTELGGLGRLMWFRCRQCGIDFNREQS